jgi:alpha-L-fucosidase 2
MEMPEPGNYSYPFQIDADLAVSGIIAEMLIQSHHYVLPKPGSAGSSFMERMPRIKLLPALPSDWESGKVTGLHARGGFELDIEWACHRIKEVEIRSTGGTVADIIFAGRTTRVTIPKNGSLKLRGLPEEG